MCKGSVLMSSIHRSPRHVQKLSGELTHTQALLILQYKAEVLNMCVLLWVDLLNVAWKVIMFNNLKLCVVHIPILLQM